MANQEKKYIVGSFDRVKEVLDFLQVSPGREVSSTHYYGVQPGSDVTKLVVSATGCEIHELTASGGMFTFLPSIPMADEREGFSWLKKRGFRSVQIVPMTYTEYAYGNGTVGLYTIDGSLRCVILYYPPEMHAAMETLFGLGGQKILTVPFNAYLAETGRVRTMTL